MFGIAAQLSYGLITRSDCNRVAALPMGAVMLEETSALAAHDALLADMPPGASHDRTQCPVCVSREQATIAPNNEEISVDDMSKRSFTLAEHEAILADAVQREVAAASTEKDDRITELEGRVDALEAEKASLVSAEAAAKQELEDYKAKAERDREIAERRDDRIKAVKAISVAELDDSYFTDKRVTRWAEMADEDFASLLEDLAAPSLAVLTPEEASALDGLDGGEKLSKLGEVLAKRREAAGEATDASGLAQRETAAFTGGSTPTGNGRTERPLSAFLSTVRG